MTIDHFNAKDFFSYLEKHGCTVYTDKYVKNENVLVYSRNATIVPIQIMSMYYPPYACKVFEALEIPSPENFEKIVAQLHELAKKQK